MTDNTQSDVVEAARNDLVSAGKAVADEIAALRGNRINDNDERRARRLARFERALQSLERVDAALASTKERCALIADRYREEAGGSQSYKRACEHIAAAIRKGDNV